LIDATVAKASLDEQRDRSVQAEAERQTADAQRIATPSRTPRCQSDGYEELAARLFLDCRYQTRQRWRIFDRTVDLHVCRYTPSGGD
jgi:hypothetical protein